MQFKAAKWGICVSLSKHARLESGILLGKQLSGRVGKLGGGGKGNEEPWTNPRREKRTKSNPSRLEVFWCFPRTEVQEGVGRSSGFVTTPERGRRSYRKPFSIAAPRLPPLTFLCRPLLFGPASYSFCSDRPCW